MIRPLKLSLTVSGITLLFVVLSCPVCWGAGAAPSSSFINIGLDKAGSPGEVAVVLQIFLLLTVLSLAPALLILLTSFTRIVIVLSLLRKALGTMQSPPNQIIIGLSLFLTIFIMTPVWQDVNKNAIQPFLEKKITQDQALEVASKPIRKFMIRQTREKDLALFVDIAKIKRPKNMDDVPTTVLIPAFVISELKTAFELGFVLFLPFLVLDLVVASVLLSMGMMMLPPMMISAPLKLLLFVLVDGWHLVTESLMLSFG